MFTVSDNVPSTCIEDRMVSDRKRSVLGGSARIVLHFSVIELEDCFESLLTGGDKKTAVGVW